MEARPIGSLAQPRFRPAPLMNWLAYPRYEANDLTGATPIALPTNPAVAKQV